jgi:F-type H+-transporting ATPase subunit gamma
MPGISKIIKNRIKSVNSARNITNAMELVAAAKIKRAVNNLLASRTYAKHARELLINLSKERSLKHPLLTINKSKKELLIVIASNRGLCGSYNINVIKATANYIKKRENKDIDFIVVGRKAESVSKHSKGKIIASFLKLPDDLYSEDIVPLSKMVIEEFIKGNYGKVSIAYTDFISSLKYEAKVSALLPITQDNLSEITGSKERDLVNKKSEAIILFEPDDEKVLNLVLPRLTEVRIYQSILEANASEHSARMVAMKNATDSAKSMIEELTIYYNKARQSGITQEIAEISSATDALTNAG